MKTKKSRIIIFIVALMIFVAGAVIMLYPIISDYFFVQENKKIVANFANDIEDNSKLEELYQKLLLENKYLYENSQQDLIDPFSYEQTAIDLIEYGLSDNCIGYITIPKINVELPIYLGASTSNMNQGAVHLTQTSYPIGGNNTNSVIAAHRASTGAKMFDNIHQLEIGDSIVITNFRETLNYEVVETDLIFPTEIDKIFIRDNKDMLTLFSCHPYGDLDAPYRYVVYCVRVE